MGSDSTDVLNFVSIDSQRTHLHRYSPRNKEQENTDSIESQSVCFEYKRTMNDSKFSVIETNCQ